MYYRKCIGDSFNSREILKPCHVGIYTGLFKILIGLVELIYLITFSCKCTYNSVTGNVFLCFRIHACKLLTKQFMLGCHAFSESEYYQEDYGRYYKKTDCQLPVHDEEIHCRSRIKCDRFNYHTYYPRYIMAHCIKVTRDSRHQVTSTVSAVELHILALDLVI